MTDSIENVQPGEFIQIKQDGPIVSFVSVTSAVAERWLAHNVHNRGISETGVLRYQDDMENGRFKMTGEPIQFSKSGVLLNGQNRLTALANCVPPTTIIFTVVRGLDDDVQFMMDQGIKRTPGQQFGLIGVKNAGQVASAARLSLVWEEGLLFSDSKVRRGVSLARVEEWVAESANVVALYNNYLAQTVRQVGAKPAVAGAVAFQGLRIDPQAIIAFFQLLQARTNLPKGSPILALDNRLRRARTERFRVSQRDELALFITAWNAWMKGESLAKLQMPKGGLTGSNFPSMAVKRGRNFPKAQLALGLELGGYEAVN
jgi:hypothetical protein